MDNQNMTYPELRDLFVEHNKTQLAKPVSACIVFADSNWPDWYYPLCSRTYEVSSDNKAFRPSCCSTSLFGSCLDGTDQMVRLDWYMKDFGNKGMIWPLFYAGAFFLVFNGIVTLALSRTEKKLDYFRV